MSYTTKESACLQPYSSAHSGTRKERVFNSIAEVDDMSSLEKQPLEGQTVRGLKTRHLTLISLGGAIGTGLFIGSGGALSTCGPLPLLLAYLIMSGLVWIVMTMIGVMSSLIPLSGETTVYGLARKYTSKSIAFTAGMNLYYAQAMIVPSEVTACALIIQYWTDVNPAAWISLFIVTSVGVNVFPVRIYGEIEFWAASLKIVCLTGLIILGIVIFFGGLPSQHGVQGFRYWKNPGPFVEHIVGGATGRFLAFWTGILKSGFAFILVPELLGSAFGEVQNARRNIHKCCSQFIYRLFFFYILAVLVIGVIIASNNPRLLNAVNTGESSAAGSPFVIAMTNIDVLPSIINACVMTAAASAGYSLFFGASRQLYSMALNGEVPRIFAKTTKHGVPIYSVGLTSLFAPLAYLNCSNSAATVFNWLTNIATIAGFISWVFIAITFIRFMKIIDYHDLRDRLPYCPPMMVPGAWLCVVSFTLLTLTNGYAVFFPDLWSVSDFFTAYITVIIVVVLYVGSVLIRREFTWFFHPKDVHLSALIARADEEEAEDAILTDEKKKWWSYIFFFIF